MPEWMTPLLWPLWCEASWLSFSSTTTRVPGRLRTTARAVARPTIPPPATTRSTFSATAQRVLRNRGLPTPRVRTRAVPLGLEVVVADLSGGLPGDVVPFGLLLPYPGSSGRVVDWTDVIAGAHVPSSIACTWLT